MNEHNKEEAILLQICEKLIRDKEKEALEEVEKALQNQPSSTQLYLLCLQLYLNQGLYEKCIQLILSFPSSLFNTVAIQSLFFNLCKQLDTEKAVSSYLQSFDSMTQRLTGHDLQSAQELASDYFFEKQQYAESTSRLQTILSNTSLPSSSRMELVCKLVLSAVYSSPEEAIRLAQQLPDVDIVENADMNELEEMLRRRDFLKKATTPAAAALSNPTTPQAEMEVEEAPVNTVVTNIRKIVRNTILFSSLGS